MRDKIVFFGTIYLVSIYGAYTIGKEQAEETCAKTQKQVKEYESPRTRCTQYNFSGPNGTKFCLTWKRIL